MKIGEFRHWCYKVLPLVYDDSLSYYEVLCKLTNYVNTLAETLRDTGEDVEELKTLYEQLNDYVVHYFDTLNIQEQVDNKLDEMAEDGTLEAMIAKYVTVYVTPEAYGAAGDGVTDDTAAIQGALDSGKNVIFDNTTYLVSKTSNAELYPDGDEPCLYLKDKQNITLYGNGAVLKVDAHGQGILEIINSKNVMISDLELQGYGSFPKLDPDSGRGEKGTTGEGYYNAAGYYEFSLFKNNSVDTSNWRGFGSDAYELWGTFGNGFIGNAGSGILIYDGCENVTVQNCTIHGFNYSGVEVGTRTNPPHDYNKYINIKNCEFYNIYDGAIFFQESSYCSASDNKIHDIGHPDAFPDNNEYSYTFADPGYGISVTSVVYNNDYRISDHIKIENNSFNRLIRKAVDGHGGRYIDITGNIIDTCYAYGMQLASQDVDKGAVSNILIANNIINNVGQRGFPIGVSAPEGTDVTENRNVTITGNIIKGSSGTYGLFVRYARHTVVTDNQIEMANCGYPLELIVCPNSVMKGNTIICPACTETLITITQSSNSVVCDNVLECDTTGDYVYNVYANESLLFHDNIFDTNITTIRVINNDGILYNNYINDGTDTTGNSFRTLSEAQFGTIDVPDTEFSPVADGLYCISARSATEAYFTITDITIGHTVMYNLIPANGRAAAFIPLYKNHVYNIATNLTGYTSCSYIRLMPVSYI